MNQNKDLQDFFQSFENDKNCQPVQQTDPFFTLWNQLGHCVKKFSCNQNTLDNTSFGIISFEDFVQTQKYARNDFSVFWYIPEWATTTRFTSFLQFNVEQFYQQESILHERQIKNVILFDFDGNTPEIITGSYDTKCFLIPRFMSPATLYFFLNIIIQQNQKQIQTNDVVPQETSQHVTIDSHSIQDLISNYYKIHNSKPTVQKLANFTGMQQNDLKKLIMKSGESWSALTKNLV